LHLDSHFHGCCVLPQKHSQRNYHSKCKVRPNHKSHIESICHCWFKQEDTRESGQIRNSRSSLTTSVPYSLAPLLPLSQASLNPAALLYLHYYTHKFCKLFVSCIGAAIHSARSDCFPHRFVSNRWKFRAETALICTSSACV